MSQMVGFKKAEKSKVHLKIALTGPSGSGKTFSALSIATGIGKKIALIDTENKSASLYADKFDFDTLEIEAPYTVQKYVDAIKLAETAGYEVLIIDSISHVWAAEGGLLTKKEELDARGAMGDKKHKSHFANWGTITKEHETFKAWLLKCNLHLICTMRSKQEYVQGADGSVKKLGMAPIQRDGMEYEFTTVFDLAMSHSAAASKDRTGLFDGIYTTPSKETGEKLMKWLNTGKGEVSSRKTVNLVDHFYKEAKKVGYEGEGLVSFVRKETGAKDIESLAKDVMAKLVEKMRAQPIATPKAAEKAQVANG